MYASYTTMNKRKKGTNKLWPVAETNWSVQQVKMKPNIELKRQIKIQLIKFTLGIVKKN